MKKLPVASRLRDLIAAALVLLSVSLAAQNAPSAVWQSEPMPKEPKLPIVRKHVLPGEGWGQFMDKWVVHRAFPLYDNWQSIRKEIATVGRGVTVTILDGINIVKQPDTIVATSNSLRVYIFYSSTASALSERVPKPEMTMQSARPKARPGHEVTVPLS